MSIFELSLCFNPDQKDTYLAELLKSSTNPLLAGLQVNIQPMRWDTYKQEITNMALYNRGADVSQVGFPLTNDLIGMNALRSISPQILGKIGGESAFHPNVWNIAKRHQAGQIWSLPWMLDPRAIFYWKDLVDQAGLNAETAFQTAESMESACQSMKDSGIDAPWVLGVADKFVMIHSVVSWVWGKGGDFISQDGTRAVFLEKNALDGLEAYFRLMPYMPQAGRPLSVADAQRLFVERKSAMTIGPYGSLRNFSAAVAPEFRDLLGVTLPPGPPLLAGSDLVLWQHSRKDDEAVKFLSALFSTEVQVGYAEYLGSLPVTKAALDCLAKLSDANVNAFATTLDKGRIFAATKFAGMLEVQLSSALADIWAGLSEHPSDDLRKTLQQTLEPVRRRFDMLNWT